MNRFFRSIFSYKLIPEGHGDGIVFNHIGANGRFRRVDDITAFVFDGVQRVGDLIYQGVCVYGEILAVHNAKMVSLDGILDFVFNHIAFRNRSAVFNGLAVGVVHNDVDDVRSQILRRACSGHSEGGSGGSKTESSCFLGGIRGLTAVLHDHRPSSGALGINGCLGQRGCFLHGILHNGIFHYGIFRCGSFLCGGLRFKQYAVAENGAVRQIVGVIANHIGGVTFDGLDAGAIMIFGGGIGGNNAHVIGAAVSVLVEEDDVAGAGGIIRSGLILTCVFQIVNPGGVQRALWNDIHMCIVQAEGNEHSAPVFVGEAAPGTVAGVALDLAGCIHDVVAGAFPIAYLALGHSQQIFSVGSPKARGQGSLPDRCILYIRRGIGVALLFVFVFFQSAEQGAVVAFCAVGMCFVLFQFAN